MTMHRIYGQRVSMQRQPNIILMPSQPWKGGWRPPFHPMCTCGDALPIISHFPGGGHFVPGSDLWQVPASPTWIWPGHVSWRGAGEVPCPGVGGGDVWAETPCAPLTAPLRQCAGSSADCPGCHRCREAGAAKQRSRVAGCNFTSEGPTQERAWKYPHWQAHSETPGRKTPLPNF